MTSEGSGSQSVHERAEIDTGLFRRLGQEAAGGEAGEGVDLEKVGVVLVVEHDVDARQVAGSDDLVRFSGELADRLDHVVREVQVEVVFGRLALVLRVEVVEVARGSDADGG